MTNRQHTDLKRDARRCFRQWARSIARGGPRPPNGTLLRAGAVIAAPQPAHLLELLTEAARHDPDILADTEAERE